MASHQEDKKQNLSPEEIGQYRATAQQNSVESIRGAEERYAKAKESGYTAIRETKEAVTQGVGAAKDFAVEKTKEGYHTAKDAAAKTMGKAKEYVYHEKGEEKVGDHEANHKDKLSEQDDLSSKEPHQYGQTSITSVLWGILGAVGESLKEIAQTAKEIVMGKDSERKD
ncbi:hypothetical protein J5N97_028184 [Dioscorea zingiberensis]|uniref:Uncharacterized protein n=1 Tax=Dioscorea zingiberensis TaxID=325984 RepID=A0A9D5H4J3_9LILI|nr:hypothetical protein J5N97_028184 [Dioscorea zingiberensis]